MSADLEELIGLSDRIIVFYQGRLVKELNAKNVTPEDLGGYMTGLKKWRWDSNLLAYLHQLLH